MKLVREHISFEKIKSKEDLKKRLFSKPIKVLGVFNNSYCELFFKITHELVPFRYNPDNNTFSQDTDDDLTEILKDNKVPYKIIGPYYNKSYVIIDEMFVDWNDEEKPVVENIQFKKSESEENFKDSLFTKKIKIVGRAPVLGYSYYIEFENDYATNNIFVTYDINKNIFYKNKWGIDYRILIKNLKENNIPFKENDKKVLFSERYVDWTPIQENIQFKKPESEEDFKDKLFSKKIRLISRAPLLGYVYHAVFNEDDDITFLIEYSLKSKIFFSLYSKMFLKNEFIKYDIPFTIKRDTAFVPEYVVDWGDQEKPIQESINFEKNLKPHEKL